MTRLINVKAWGAFALAAVLVAALAVMAPQRAAAQATVSTGSIQGTVTDPTGAVLPGAKITVTSKDTGQVVHLTATSTGAYSSGALLPGNYTIRIEAKGFKTLEVAVVVQVGVVTPGNFTLQLGAETTVVQVAEQGLRPNTEQAGVQDVLTAQQIEELPVNGRNFLDLAILEPGVQIQDGATFDPTKNGYSSLSFGGRFGRTARIELDGLDISDETVGTTTQNIPQSAIQEFQVSQSTLDLSTELTSSGGVNVTTRSGTNSFHGQGFFYGRSDQTSARIAPTQLDFARKQYGANFGGPFFKNKLFFFGDWERTQQDLNNPVTLIAPFTALSGSFNSPFRESEYVAKVDYKIRPGWTAFYRFSYDQNSSVRGFNPGVYQPFANVDHAPVHAMGTDFNTGRFSHSFRVGYIKFRNAIADAFAAVDPANILGSTPGVSISITPSGGDFTCLGGGEAFCSGTNILAPQETFQTNKQFKYDGSWTFRSHILRYGIGVNKILGGGFAKFFQIAPYVASIFNPSNQAIAASGTLTCPGGATGASCPLNWPVNTVVMGNGQGFFTEIPQFGFPAGGQFDTRFQWYLGDGWKARHNLTITYGVHYVRDTGRADSDLPAIAALNQFGPNLGRPVRQPSRNLGPQLGIAWDPWGNGRTVVRIGSGIYYENAIFNNVLFDRPGRLQKGLFFGTGVSCFLGTPLAVPLPGGGSIPAPTFCNQPIGAVASQIVAEQQTFQSAVVAAGPQSNGSFIGNSLAEGVNSTGDQLISPDYRTPYSWQLNVGIQRQFGANTVLSVDYARNVGLHYLLGIDTNHVGDTRFLDRNAAVAAISATNNAFGCTTATTQAAINCAISGVNHGGVGATIADYAGNGLDSGVSFASGFPCGPGVCAFPGINPNIGQNQMLFPIGRSVYNALLISLKSNLQHPLRGMNRVSLIASYALSRFNAQALDQDFINNAPNFRNPNSFLGPNALDRTSQLGVGGVIDFPAATRVSFAGHWNTALPQTLILPNSGLPGEIFRSDIYGDGSFGGTVGGDILPGTNIGSFGRSVKSSNLASAINNWNNTGAGQLTPAGQALTTAINPNTGLPFFTAAQLGVGDPGCAGDAAVASSSLCAVTPKLAPPVPGHIGISPLFIFDIHVSWLLKPSKLWSNVPESVTVEPQVSIFNVFNYQNYDPGGNILSGVLQPACTPFPSCVAPGNVTGQTHGSRTNLIAPGAASGVNWYAVPRQAEFGIKITF